MIRDAGPEDYEPILSLNEAVVHYLSPLDMARLQRLALIAAHFRVIEREREIAAFLLCFREGTDYDSPNYSWFSQAFTRFMYIDRVVVAPGQHGRGFARLLYQDVETACLRTGITLLTCEVDMLPPNERSLQFHDKQGFAEIARHTPYPNRVVSLRTKDL